MRRPTRVIHPRKRLGPDVADAYISLKGNGSLHFVRICTSSGRRVSGFERVLVKKFTLTTCTKCSSSKLQPLLTSYSCRLLDLTNVVPRFFDNFWRLIGYLTQRSLSTTTGRVPPPFLQNAGIPGIGALETSLWYPYSAQSASPSYVNDDTFCDKIDQKAFINSTPLQHTLQPFCISESVWKSVFGRCCSFLESCTLPVLSLSSERGKIL